MPDDSYTAWVNIFDNDLSRAYSCERKELKSAAMILCALQKEFERVRASVESEFKGIHKELEQKDQHIDKKVRLSLSSKENTPPRGNDTNKSKPPEQSESNTPDFFEDNLPSFSSVSTSEVVDLSTDTEDFSINTIPSPTLKKKRIHCRKSMLTPSLCFIPNTLKQKETAVFETPVINKKSDNLDMYESTVIDNTPEVRFKKSKTIKSNLFLSKKKLLRTMRSTDTGSNTTLTQYFQPSGSSSFKPETQDSFIQQLVSTNRNIVQESPDFDVTSIEDLPSKSTLEITDILNIINKENVEVKNSQEEDISHTSLNQASADETYFNMDTSNNYDNKEEDNLNMLEEEDNLNFSISFLNNEEEYNIPVKKNKTDIYPDGPVRGKARKQLEGWSCEECRKFYECLNLPPHELKKKMNDCSKHRGKQLDETIPGFWDMTIKTQD